MDAVSEFRRIPSVLNGEMVRFFGIEQIRPDRLLYEELIKDLPEGLGFQCLPEPVPAQPPFSGISGKIRLRLHFMQRDQPGVRRTTVDDIVLPFNFQKDADRDLEPGIVSWRNPPH